MTPLEIGLTICIISFFIKEVFWNKAQKNQDKIDSDIVESVKDHDDKIIELEKKHIITNQKILNFEGDIKYLKEAWQHSNENTSKLAETITLFDKNMKSWHEDSRMQNAEMKKSLDRSNELVYESTKINTELLGVLKNLGSK